jgi:hypothetical protein
MERATLTTRPTSRPSRGILLGALSAIAVVSVAAAQIPSVTRRMQVQAETTSFDSSAQLVLWSGHVRVEIPACRLSSDKFRVNYGVIFTTLRLRVLMAAFGSIRELGGLREEMPSSTPPVARSY